MEKIEKLRNPKLNLYKGNSTLQRLGFRMVKQVLLEKQ